MKHVAKFLVLGILCTPRLALAETIITTSTATISDANNGFRTMTFTGTNVTTGTNAATGSYQNLPPLQSLQQQQQQRNDNISGFSAAPGPADAPTVVRPSIPSSVPQGTAPSQ